MNTRLMSLIADPTRLEILRLVWTGERAAGDIAGRFKTTFGAVSQHLRRLLDSGVVTRRRDGRHQFYRANREAIGPLAAALEAMWAEKLATLKTLAEAEQQAINQASTRTPQSEPIE
ncbi:MAG: winged helix-turn-helix transcriptional regulator [Phycisphaerales bacterium]|nr:winged helix-turn-helix transcriptional regulator [Phycisphaerales bacterium]